MAAYCPANEMNRRTLSQLFTVLSNWANQMGGAKTVGPGGGRIVTWRPFVILCSSKESAMLNWLLRFWRRIGLWIHPRPAPKTYYPSNLHGRRR
jgi:hypothetical protein